ncbi:hypothetical protein Lesp02_03190 [Lentzea sp. NBRC 105346]|uniref:hypothetical protein n=1 Tax=Lentzea sp. NBRC 105346 TaxID=3032205 RepID=UPI0024A00FDC|nr:hypothetical protein [Lentzea sp. NBRC 105346]GLZ28129.1 hypothetical protein Lesp02_03190 [Lentzea sp. NBRC 105346]
MTNPVAVSEILEMIELALDVEDHHYALELAGEIIDHADPDTLGLLTEIAETFQTYPKIAPVKLGETWKRSTAEDREIIATCVEIRRERQHSPSPESESATKPEVVLRADVHTPSPREADELWTGRPTDTARCDKVRRKFSAEARRDPRPPKTEAEKRADKVFASYRRFRAGVDDYAVRETPPGYELDYDDAAIPPLRGLACVQCFSERTPQDHDQRHDDGLCTECRSLNRPGLPSLHADPYRDEVIANRCSFIAATYRRSTAHAIFRREWYGYSPADHVDYVDWVLNWLEGRDPRSVRYEDLSNVA